MNTTATFSIVGMHCSACAMNIDFTLEDLSGVQSSKTSYAKQELELEYDPAKIALSQIEKALLPLGYSIAQKDDRKSK